MLLNKFIVLLIILCLSGTSYSTCNQPVVSIEKGQAAPCSGYLFTPEKEQEVRLMKIEFIFTKKENEILNKKIKLFDKDIEAANLVIKKEREHGEVWRTTAITTTKNLVAIEESRGTRDVLLFGTGILTAVLVSFIIKNVVR
jgi:hypothetical protein